MIKLQKCKCGCGKAFRPKVTRGNHKLFFNNKCARRYYDKRKNERAKEERRAAAGDRTCRNPKCGAPLPADARLNQLYCSRDCLEVTRRTEYKEEAPDRHCQSPWCNAVLPRTESRWKDDYCGDQCKKDAADLREHLLYIRATSEFVGQIPGAGDNYFAPSTRIRAMEHRAND